MKNKSQRAWPKVQEILAQSDAALWGLADLTGLSAPLDSQGRPWPRAVSFAYPMNPQIMASIKHGPNQAYADLYTQVNGFISELSRQVESAIRELGYEAQALAPSERSNPKDIRGDFPHKTAATRGGLGWVGRNCQLITKSHGPWVRLGTVFTDLVGAVSQPVISSRCGKCMDCVQACPTGALSGELWEAGMEREKILDAAGCDQWKKENYLALNRGHTCGICAAACPFGK